jgi:hypothetical protein
MEGQDRAAARAGFQAIGEARLHAGRHVGQRAAGNEPLAGLLMGIFAFSGEPLAESRPKHMQANRPSFLAVLRAAPEGRRLLEVRECGLHVLTTLAHQANLYLGCHCAQARFRQFVAHVAFPLVPARPASTALVRPDAAPAAAWSPGVLDLLRPHTPYTTTQDHQKDSRSDRGAPARPPPALLAARG